MHVLLIPSWHDIDYSKPNIKFFHSFAKAFEHTEVEMGIVYGEFNWSHFLKRIIIDEELPYHYVGIQGWSLPKWGFLWKIWINKYHNLFEVYVKRFGFPDLLHTHSILGGIAGASISKHTGIPMIYTEHLTPLSGIRKELLTKAEKSISISTLNTAVSRHFAEHLSQIFNSTFEYIPNMVETDIFLPSHKPKDRIKIITIGEPAYIKGLDIILHAWKIILNKFPHAILQIVDEIRDIEFIEPIIQQYDFSSSIEFHGVIPPEEVAQLISESTLLVSASRFESFGMTMVEALSCGVPVVATRTSGSQTIINKNVGKLVAQSDHKALAQACINMIESITQYPPEVLRKYAIDYFGIHVTVNKWIEKYSKTIKSIHG